MTNFKSQSGDSAFAATDTDCPWARIKTSVFDCLPAPAVFASRLQTGRLCLGHPLDLGSLAMINLNA